MSTGRAGCPATRRRRPRSRASVGLLAALLLHAGCSQRRPATLSMPSPTDERPAEYPGLHNVVAYHEGLLSGSAPDGDGGFDSLASLGVRTIISVDGAQPNVEAARVRGLRYVHLPIGYDGMDRSRTLEIARAIRDLPGPIYLHCHHGRHRSAAAAGAAAVALGLITNDDATRRMKVSGTSPSYAGLYRCVAAATIASAAELGGADDAFPERWKTSGLVRTMVEIDAAMDCLKRIERAGWRTPTDHPDLVAAAEAGAVADLLRNLEDDPECGARSAEFRGMLRRSAALAAELEGRLVSGQGGRAELGERLARLSGSCTECHARYRD